MNKQVIHFFGAAGSGTSTLGRFISGRMGCYFMDTDDYYWAPTDPPFTTKREIPERLRLMRRDIDAHDGVVISGSLVGWGDVLIPCFTLAIRVETPTAVRLERIRKRERERFGARLDEGGDMHDGHLRFLEWAAAYDEGGPEMRSRAGHDAWQKLLPCPLLSVDGSLPPETNFGKIRQALAALPSAAR